MWKNYSQSVFDFADYKIALDFSKTSFNPAKPEKGLADKMHSALKEMKNLESGEISNPDENRMVGHYWLRNPALAPNREIQDEILKTLENIKKFSADVHSGKILSEKGKKFSSLLVIGIGGSALGPQFINHALAKADDPLSFFIFDNTDPDGMQRTLNRIGDLSTCLAVVISKSGGTKETRNGMLVAKSAFEAAGLNFSKQAVAVTGEGSQLSKYGKENGWLAEFPMWDFIGGRTSELASVGLLPAALQGRNIDLMLKGAKEIDQLTRSSELASNPAALLALAWYQLGDGTGKKDMVVLPYSDQLELFSKYLQQLVMESLGKELNLDGKNVNQGISVFGNKGSTDQHAYIQQLRDGLNNFFAVFIEVLQHGKVKGNNFCAADLEVEENTTAGDFLGGFYQGTRKALFENGRKSITITIESVSEYSIGQLIALFERTVGLYASLINVNAYHQPGVEAGKKAAEAIVDLQRKVMEKNLKFPIDYDKVASELGADPEDLFILIRRLVANGKLGEKSWLSPEAK